MDKGYERFILVRPLAVKVKAYVQLWWNCCGLEDQGAESLYLDLELLFLVLELPLGRAFIYIGRRPPAYRILMPARSLLCHTLQYKSCITWRFIATGLNLPLGLGPSSLCSKPLYSLSSWAFKYKQSIMGITRLPWPVYT